MDNPNIICIPPRWVMTKTKLFFKGMSHRHIFLRPIASILHKCYIQIHQSGLDFPWYLFILSKHWQQQYCTIKHWAKSSSDFSMAFWLQNHSNVKIFQNANDSIFHYRRLKVAIIWWWMIDPGSWITMNEKLYHWSEYFAAEPDGFFDILVADASRLRDSPNVDYWYISKCAWDLEEANRINPIQCTKVFFWWKCG